MKSDESNQTVIKKIEKQIDDLNSQKNEIQTELDQLRYSIGLENYDKFLQWVSDTDTKEEMQSLMSDFFGLQDKLNEYEQELIKIEAQMEEQIAQFKNYEGVWRSFTHKKLRRNTWLSVLLTVLNATTFMMILSTMVILTFDAVEQHSMTCIPDLTTATPVL